MREALQLLMDYFINKKAGERDGNRRKDEKKKEGKRSRKERRGKGRKEKYREKERGTGGTTLMLSEKEDKSKIHFRGRPLQLVRNRK